MDRDILGNFADHLGSDRWEEAGITTKSEHRHAQSAGAGEGGAIVGGVLIEGAVDLEPGTHRARHGEGIGIAVEVLRADRLRIEGVPVVEVLQVETFAPAVSASARPSPALWKKKCHIGAPTSFGVATSRS